MQQYCAAGELRKEMGISDPRCEGCECPRIPMSKLACLSCLAEEFKILETRSYEDVVYRIRECKNCGKRYMTEERIISERRSLS